MHRETIDQTASELVLHRVWYVIKFLRVMVLHLVLVFIAVLLYFFAGIQHAYPVAAALIDAVLADAIDSRIQWGPSGVVRYLIYFAVVMSAMLALLIWTYRSITSVRKMALRIQATFLVVLSLLLVPVNLPNLRLAFRHLDFLFAILATANVSTGVIASAFVALALMRVARLEERSSLLANLDPRLAPNFWVYLTKLLDLPRTPLSTSRTLAAFLLALGGALLMIASYIFLITVGGASNKLSALATFSRHGLLQDAITASVIEARRIIWLLPCALAGAKLAAFFQSTAKRIGGLSVSDVVKGSVDRFILYLRPFGLDDVILPKPQLTLGNRIFSFRPHPVQIEEELFDVADGYLPLIAVGKPDESGEMQGGEAYRAYVADSDWQSYVADKIRRADRIVMVVEETEGVRWEIGRIPAEAAVAKTLFFFPPRFRDADAWQAVESSLTRMLQNAGVVPENFAFESRPIGFFFRGETMVEITNANWSATSYRTAFSHFLAESAG